MKGMFLKPALSAMAATLLLGGCGSMPIQSTLDNLTNETMMRTSDNFDFTSFVSISGLAPQQGAQLMFHQPEFYDLKPGSPAYSIGVSPDRSFVAEKIYPMNSGKCSKSDDDPDTGNHDDVVRRIRDALEDVRNQAVELLALRVEQELMQALVSALPKGNAAKTGLADRLTAITAHSDSDAGVAEKLASLPKAEKDSLAGQLKSFADQCKKPAVAKPGTGTPPPEAGAVTRENTVPECGVSGDVLAQVEGLEKSLGTETPDGALARGLKRALGKTGLTESQAVVAKAVSGEKSVDSGNHIDLGDLRAQAAEADKKIAELEREIKKSAKKLRKNASCNNVVITRWAREKKSVLGGLLSEEAAISGQNHEVRSGILVMGGLRAVTLYTGEDFVDLLKYSQGRYLGFLKDVGITTYALQAKHIAYAADRDVQRTLAARFNLSQEQLKQLSKIVEGGNIDVNAAFGLGLDLGNSGSISGSTVTTKTRPFFPPWAFEKAVRDEIEDSSCYQTVFAVTAKIKAPFVDAAMRMRTNQSDVAEQQCRTGYNTRCETNECLRACIDKSVSCLNIVAPFCKKPDCAKPCGARADSPECLQCRRMNDCISEKFQNCVAEAGIGGLGRGSDISGKPVPVTAESQQ